MFVRPERIVEQLHLAPGDQVVDCGAGGGFFAFPIAERVGKQGRVYALDIQPVLVDAIARTARERDISQVVSLLADIEHAGGIPLKDSVARHAVLAHVLFQTRDKLACIQEVARTLERGGQLAIVEWKDSFRGIGPHPDHVIPEEQVHIWCDAAGLLFIKPIETGTYQYGALFKKL